VSFIWGRFFRIGTTSSKDDLLAARDEEDEEISFNGENSLSIDIESWFGSSEDVNL